MILKHFKDRFMLNEAGSNFNYVDKMFCLPFSVNP